MSQHTSPITYVDQKVVDEHGDEIGTVTDALYLDQDTVAGHETPRPTYLVVDPGLLRAAHYVPFAGSYRTDDGDIVVPWSADVIKSAPKAGKEHVITNELRSAVDAHYAVTA